MESSQFRSDKARGEDAFRSIRTSEPAGSEPPRNGGASTFNTPPGLTGAGEQPRLQAQLLDAVGQAIIATDLQGTVTYWNRCAEQLYGWSAQEVTGRVLQQFLISADYRDNMVEIMANLRAGRNWSGELVTHRKDGTTVTVEVTDTPVQDDRGRVVGIVGTWTNITERRAAYARLRETERRLLTLLSNTPAMVYRCLNKPDWPEEYVSEYALELTGYPASAFMDRPTLFGDLIAERDKERIWDEVQEALERCERFRLRYTMHHRDGGLRFVEELGQGVYDESGNVVAVEGLIYDVTDRERVEMRLREAENRYRTLVERIPAIVYTQEPHEPSRTTYVSPQNEAILGYSPEECLNDPEHWIRITHPEDRERVLAEDGRTNQSGEAFAMEYRQFASDGRTVWIRDEATLVRDEEGNPLYWLGVQTDVTERKRAEAKHRETEVRYRSLVEHVPVAIYRQEIEHNGAVTYISPQIEALTGYAPDEYADPALWIRTMHPEDRQRVLDEDKRTDETGEPFRVEFRKFTRDGRLIWLRDEAVLVRDGGGAPLYWQGVVQDITERKALEEQLEHQALHDSLTDLPNRALFIDRLRHALMRTKRRKDGMVAVLFMDLDGFKDVNDSMGHEAGDLLLVVVAERLRRCLRPEDTLARFGGDEFVVLIEDAQGPDGAVRLAERITTELKKPFSIEGKELFVAASIGIALGEDRTKSPEEILRDADTAMYRAKDQAADYSVFDPAMYLWAVGRLELQNDLRRAAERNEFVLHYQPIVSLEDGTIQGVEALVRWVHPERGILNPDEFVPVAEMSGLVLPMGEKILEEACRQAQVWQAKYHRTSSMIVSVNVSAKHLARPDLARMVEETLEKTGMDANRLSLDITETAYVEVLDGNRAALARLRALGVRLSIDDFGTGYSSLSYLKRLPADTLKIDKTFMRGLGVDIQDTAVVRTVVELAHTFGMHVIAEGVETEEQAALLYEMGCDSAQGYLFSKPLEPHAVVELLRSAYGRSLPEL